MGLNGLKINNMQTLAVANQNPGNLKNPATGSFQSFSDPLDGKAALYNDLTAKMTGTSKTGLNGNSSLLDFAKTYAPAGDNNDPAQYAANIANKMGISPDDKIGTLMPRIDDFASAVASNEDPSAKYTPHKSLQISGFNPKPYSSAINEVDYSNLTPTTDTSKPQTQGLGQELIGRTSQAGQAIQNTISGKINPVSGVIQTVGAAAGAVNDVVGAGLELIPGVKWLEQQLGQGVGKLAQTPVGQSVVKSIQGFQKEHPELSDDISAGFNIATAIPIFRGLAAVKELGADAISQGLRGIVQKGFANDMAESATTQTAKRLLTPEVIDTMIKEGAVPDLITEQGRTKLSTQVAQDALSESISKIENGELQPALKGTDLQFPIEGVKNLAKPIAIDELRNPEAVNRILDSVAAKYGDTPTLEQLNMAKRDVSNLVPKREFGSENWSNSHIARSALQKSIEQASLQFGLGDVNEINGRMASLIKAQDFLNSIEGKTIPKRGIMHTLIKGASLAGGEAVGNAIGMPIAGTLAGGGVSGAIENTLNQITPRAIRAGIIKRTAEGAVSQGLGEAAGKVGVMVGANVIGRLPQNIKTPTSALSIPVNQMNNETAVQEVEADAKPIVKGLTIQLSNGKIYKFPNSQALQTFMKEAGL